MEKQRKRHCWECRRRCLVCDSTEPACKRCAATGIECPGYGHVKPTRLKWLAPGTVVSRGGRRERNGVSPVEVENSFRKVTRLTIPRIDLDTEGRALSQAALYFNSCIYLDLLPLHDLGHNPHVYPLSTALLRAGAMAPDYLRFGMVCMTLSHRINRLRSEAPSKILTQRFYQYWGLAVRSLNEHLNSEKTRMGDMIVAGIMTLLLTDIQNGTSLNWRCHLDGVYKLIMLRGGFQAVAGSPSLYPLLLSFWSVAVFGNTTSPASNLSTTCSHLSAMDFLPDQYRAAASPFQLCPIPLFTELIRINHLRAQSTTTPHRHCPTTLFLAAREILFRIEAFSPEAWSASKLPSSSSSRQDWLLVGRVYQATVAIYCILSLQSVAVLPPMSHELRASGIAHGKLLWALLTRGMQSRSVKRFLVWPLAVLGVEVAYLHEHDQDKERVREFVVKALGKMSWDIGSSVPLTAKQVLEEFWWSGQKGWDACFCVPHVFTGQIAVDTKGLYSLGA
ncbi:hypothetical protein VTI74DRAFT_2205 [Chaetomium olivicolor]